MQCSRVLLVVSESVLSSKRGTSVDNHLDFGATTPFLGLDAVGSHALRLGQKMEIAVNFLSFILVIVKTKFVVMSGGVLPLGASFDSEELQELLNLNL